MPGRYGAVALRDIGRWLTLDLAGRLRSLRPGLRAYRPTSPSPHSASGCQHFDLRLWFGVAGFCVTAVLTVGFTLAAGRLFTTMMLDREVAVTQEYLQNILIAEGYERGSAADGSYRDASPTEVADHLRTIPETVQANLYGVGGRVLWSTDPVRIGRGFQSNAELQQAFAGQVASRLRSEPSGYAPFGQRVIQTYVPMWHGAEVIGVLAVHRTHAELEKALGRGRHIVEASATVAGLLLFGALYWVVLCGAGQIQRQQAELCRMDGLATLGQMAGAIAHSFRNPLDGIRSATEAMRLDHPDAAPAADGIVGEVGRLDEHVREFAAYACNDPISPQPVDPFDLVRGMLSRQRAALRRARVEVAVDDRRAAKRLVALDPLLLIQAMTSIVGHAIAGMPDGGRLRVALAEPDSRHSWIMFFGMPSGLLAGMSDPPAAMPTPTPGLELGLALARRVLERSGGSLQIGGDGADRSLRIALRSLR